MIPDPIGQQLHDLATRGEVLAPEEHSQLQEWYAQHDQQEMAQLAAAPPPSDLGKLQALVQQTTAQLATQSQRIHAQVAENVELQREIARLRQQLQAKTKASAT